MTWTDHVAEALTGLWTKVGAFLPNLLGMLVILIVGYFVSKILQKVGTAILKRIGFESASERVGVRTALDRAGIRLSPSEIVGRVVFWLFMLTFLISAAETLGLQNVSQTIDSFVGYLPNVIAAAVIAVVGLMLGHFTRDLVRSGLEGLKVEYAPVVANLAFGVLIVVVGSLAIGQLQIETQLINRVVEISLFATGAAIALALGLGSRDVAKNIVAGGYVRDTYHEGVQIAAGPDRGQVEEVGTISTRLKTEDGRYVHIPNGQLAEMVVRQGATA